MHVQTYGPRIFAPLHRARRRYHFPGEEPLFVAGFNVPAAVWYATAAGGRFFNIYTAPMAHPPARQPAPCGSLSHRNVEPEDRSILPLLRSGHTTRIAVLHAEVRRFRGRSTCVPTHYTDCIRVSGRTGGADRQLNKRARTGHALLPHVLF